MSKLKETLKAKKWRSAWLRGVRDTALELADYYDNNYNGQVFNSCKDLHQFLLNGASNWNQYAWGGCGLISNYDIAKRFCSPSEFKKKRGGELKPNSRMEWLDVYASALLYASYWVYGALKELSE